MRLGPQPTACGQIVRSDDPDRFLVTLFAPPAARPALWSVFALDLALGDIAFKARDRTLALIRLQWWREGVEAIHRGDSAARHPVLEALAESVRTHALAPALFEALFEAQDRALDDTPFPTLDAFVSHVAAREASLLTLAVRCLEDKEAAAALAALGSPLAAAWGLTARLRAAPARLRHGLKVFAVDGCDERSADSLALYARSVGMQAREQLGTLCPVTPYYRAMAGLTHQYLARFSRYDYNLFGCPVNTPPDFSALRLWAHVNFRKKP